MSRPIRVLVVDDSAFARKVVRECLLADPEIEVIGIARDGLDALEKIAVLNPDVITLDLMMPHLDGIGVLTGLRRDCSARVVVCSSADDDNAVVIQALSLGAITSVHKPTSQASDRLYEMGRPLVEAVKLAAEAQFLHVAPAARLPSVTPLAVPTRMLVIGASTGGPQAISSILRQLPANFPVPVAIVVHMPVGYTEGFATRLNEQCALEVVEASEGASFSAGRVIICRAGLHLKVSAAATVHLDVEPLDRPHRPAVDVLFSTAAAVFGPSVLGVVLTGMGSDGLIGARTLVAAGGRVLTQSAPSCVVYGMPRVVAEAGLAAGVFSLEDMPRAILQAL